MATFRSVPEMFLHRVAETPDKEAFRFAQAGAWKSLTWRETGDRVRAIASGLRALGVGDEQRCAILCGTRYEWILCDLGILCAGAVTSTIYPSSSAEESQYILSDSQTVLVFAEDAGQVAKLASVRDRLPGLEHVVVIDGAGGHDGWVITLDELMQKGRAEDGRDPAAFERVARAVRPDSLATLIYTSGTTGRPKGVELTHANWVYEGDAIDELKLITKDDVQYLWLPLSHSFGKVLEAAQLKIGFPTAIDGRVDKIVENLAVVQPTFVAAVPRIFEKVHNKVVQGAREAGGLKLKIFEWAFSVGAEVSKLRQQGREPSGLLALKNAIAHKLVFSKLHARFGGRLKYFVSGSAPLARELADWFHAAGILILEGYGLTETSAATFVNRPASYRFGTVGMPMPGTSVKIADDGEILIKGPGNMRGYHKLGDATTETLDAEGWLHTGDIGHVHDGFLRITDRKKELIKTSGGKYVAPAHIEGRLKAACPYISQALVHGNNRNYCSALVTLDEEAIKKWAAEQGIAATGMEALAKDDKVRALIQQAIDELNRTLERWETIKKFAILPRDFTLENEELTPSLKMKRKVIEGKNKAVLDGFYEGAMAEG